jgi:hypothetical protein
MDMTTNPTKLLQELALLNDMHSTVLTIISFFVLLKIYKSFSSYCVDSDMLELKSQPSAPLSYPSTTHNKY